MFSSVRKYIPSAPTPQNPCFLTDAQLHQLITVKYDFVCSLDDDQAKSRMVDIAKVFAQNLAAISTSISDSFLFTDESIASPLASAITPLIGCISDTGQQIIHYEAHKCLHAPILNRKQALKVITSVFDVLPTKSFVILADMSRIPAHSWLRGKFSGIGDIWRHVLDVICHQWACNVGRVVCYHVSFTTQAYISTKINEPALEIVKYSKLTQSLQNMGTRCIEKLQKHLDDMESARNEWQTFLGGVQTKGFGKSVRSTKDSPLSAASSTENTQMHFKARRPVSPEEETYDVTANTEPPILACTEAPTSQVSSKSSQEGPVEKVLEEHGAKTKAHPVLYVDTNAAGMSDTATDEGDEVMT